MAVLYTNGWASRNPKVQNGKITQEVIKIQYDPDSWEDATVFNFRDNFFLEINSYPQGDAATGTGLKVYGYTAFIVWEGEDFDSATEPEFDIITQSWEPA